MKSNVNNFQLVCAKGIRTSVGSFGCDVSVAKELDTDKSGNFAKSVTVE